MSFFLGIAFDAATRAHFERGLALAQPHFPRARWEKPEKAHLTLVFLAAERPDDALVADVCRRHAPLQLRLRDGGCFSDSVLWLGVAGDLKPLAKLQSELQRSLQIVDRHDGYTPHVTLARGTRLSAAMLTGFESDPFAVTEVSLFESQRGEYRVLRTFATGTGPPPA